MEDHYERRGHAIYGPDSGPGTATHIGECGNSGDADKLVDELNANAHERSHLRLELASCHRKLGVAMALKDRIVAASNEKDDVTRLLVIDALLCKLVEVLA